MAITEERHKKTFDMYWRLGGTSERKDLGQYLVKTGIDHEGIDKDRKQAR